MTTVQKDAASALLKHDIGVFCGPPGIGKTVLGTYLVAERARSPLILVHRKPLLDQWIAQLAMFLGLEGEPGWADRRRKAETQRSARRSDDPEPGTKGPSRRPRRQLWACHRRRVSSRACRIVRASAFRGEGAIPRWPHGQRRDGHQPITEMQLGPIRFNVDVKIEAARRPFEHRLIVRETLFRMADDDADASIQDIYRALARDEERNRRILDDVIVAVNEGRSPIVLTERKDHLEYLGDHLRAFVRHLVLLHGGMTPKERRIATERLASIPDTAERLVLATGRYIGEGFDDARLDTLFLAMPISWKGVLIQYSGRLHRRHSRKTQVRIYDYVDREVPMLLRMFEKRLRTYRAIGYARGEAPLGFAEPPGNSRSRSGSQRLASAADQDEGTTNEAS